MPQCFRQRMSTHEIFVFGVRLFIGIGVIGWAQSEFKNALHAAPLTFRFDAQISRLALGSPFDLPFEFQVGDAISGKFTFEPGPGVEINDLAVVAEQPLPFELNIDGVRLPTSGYRIVASDDTFDYDSERPPYDGLTLDCLKTTCTSDTVNFPGSESFKVRWVMWLTGSDSVWSTPAVVSDVNVWNAFTDERRIHVSFDNAGPGSVGFDALVSSMSQVPEPALLGVLLVPAIHCSIHNRRRRHL